jgi:uncharacterized protein YjiS (DUF1127 family)
MATRLARVAFLGNLVFAAMSASAPSHAAPARAWRKRRRARIIYEAMLRLDYRTLRDIGLERNELAPIALELKREAAYTRARGSPASQTLPRVKPRDGVGVSILSTHRRQTGVRVSILSTRWLRRENAYSDPES